MSTDYESPSAGHEVSAVLHGIDETLLADASNLRAALLEGLAKDDFTILREADYRFTPHGYTIMVLLAESHVAIHTYPEHRSLYFNLYSCRGEGDGMQTFEYLKAYLQATSVDVVERRIVVTR